MASSRHATTEVTPAAACFEMSAASDGRSAGMYRVAPSATESSPGPLSRWSCSGGRSNRVFVSDALR